MSHVKKFLNAAAAAGLITASGNAGELRDYSATFAPDPFDSMAGSQMFQATAHSIAQAVSKGEKPKALDVNNAITLAAQDLQTAGKGKTSAVALSPETDLAVVVRPAENNVAVYSLNKEAGKSPIGDPVMYMSGDDQTHADKVIAARGSAKVANGL